MELATTPNKSDNFPKLRRVCAYCGAPKDGLGAVQEGEKVSHGICRKCFSEKFGELFSAEEIDKMYKERV